MIQLYIYIYMHTNMYMCNIYTHNIYIIYIGTHIYRYTTYIYRYTYTNTCVYDDMCRYSLGSQRSHYLPLECMNMMLIFSREQRKWHCGVFLPAHIHSHFYIFLNDWCEQLAVSSNSLAKRMKYIFKWRQPCTVTWLPDFPQSSSGEKESQGILA